MTYIFIYILNNIILIFNKYVYAVYNISIPIRIRDKIYILGNHYQHSYTENNVECECAM